MTIPTPTRGITSRNCVGALGEDECRRSFSGQPRNFTPNQVNRWVKSNNPYGASVALESQDLGEISVDGMYQSSFQIWPYSVTLIEFVSILSGGQPEHYPYAVWTGAPPASSVRDASIIVFNGHPILSANKAVVEYPDLAHLTPAEGTPYHIKLYTHDGSEISEAYPSWEKVYLGWNGSLYMYTSLPKPSVPYDFTSEPSAGQPMRIYVFEPLPGATTAAGFPLDWRMLLDGHPLIYDDDVGYHFSYSARPFVAPDGTLWISYDAQIPEGRLPGRVTCIFSRRMVSPTVAGEREFQLLCPGPRVGDGWDTAHPYPSENRQDVGYGPLVEGGWLYYSAANGKYYMFYSSGHMSATVIMVAHWRSARVTRLALRK